MSEGKLTSKTEYTPYMTDSKGNVLEYMEKQLGGSYDPNLDVKDVAKKVRELIKKAVKAGLLPKSLKASVRIERYSMGRSLYVRVTKCDECFINVDAWRTQAGSNYNLSWADVGGRYNALGREIKNTLEQFVKAFQKSERHGQSDYHSCNYFGSVDFCSGLTSDQCEKFAEISG